VRLAVALLALGEIVEAIAQRRPLDALEHAERPADARLAELVDRDDRRVLQLREDPRLGGHPALEQVAHPGGQIVAFDLGGTFIDIGVKILEDANGRFLTVGISNSAPVPFAILWPQVSNGVFTATLSGGNTNRGYVIEVGPNLSNWTALLTVSNVSGQVIFSDTNAPPPVGVSRGYRVRLLP